MFSIKTERQNMIHLTHTLPIMNVSKNYQEMIDWTLEKYKVAVNSQKMNEQVIINNIIEELDRKRKIAIKIKSKNLY